MTYLELKNNIRDLGFEEDSTLQEYDSIVRTNTNRATNIIIQTVIVPYKGYFIADNPEWEMPPKNQINEATEDTYVIQLPDDVIDLLPLLSAYYIWLDDDETKSIIYQNAYDSLKSEMLNNMTKTKLTFSEGLVF